MTAQKRKETADAPYAAAYWEVFYGVLGKETADVLRTLLVPSGEEPEWSRIDHELEERFGWLAKVIRDKAATKARMGIPGEAEDSEGPTPPSRKPRP